VIARRAATLETAKAANSSPRRPTREELAAAAGRTVRDVIAPGLRVLFCGINPGLYTAATGHHFARPGNRFWPALHAAGFTPRLFAPHEERRLLALGYGITNVVARATAAADELTPAEFVAGGRKLFRKVRRHKPAFLAVLGVGAYRAAFDRPKARLGPQDERIGDTLVWVLPNPSGLNAHYQPGDLARLFAELRAASEAGI
jgi:TDG/mug DNA glycosylase family protein